MQTHRKEPCQTVSQGRKRQERNDGDAIEGDDGLVALRVGAQALGPHFALPAGASIGIRPLDACAAARLEPLAQAELARTCRARVLRVSGREERHHSCVGREAGAPAQVRVVGGLGVRRLCAGHEEEEHNGDGTNSDEAQRARRHRCWSRQQS